VRNDTLANSLRPFAEVIRIAMISAGAHQERSLRARAIAKTAGAALPFKKSTITQGLIL
jgi:hypothetical protein